MDTKPWSFSTTIRNPERIVAFLRVLNNFNGADYNDKTKIRFEKRLIQSLNYKPSKRNLKIDKKYAEGIELTEEDVEWLISNNPQQIGWVGRSKTHLKILNELGLFYVSSDNKLIISGHGKQLINESISINKVFLRILIKWQYPTFFRKSNKMNIIPLIATLNIIQLVNKKWRELGNNPVGLSKLELGLFVIVTTDYNDINQTVDNIINFRKKEYGKKEELDKLIKEKVEMFFGKYTYKKECTLIKDYPDNICRYFSLTGLFTYRGGRRYIDLSELKEEEINNILNNFSPKPIIFNNIEEEIVYKIDINKPEFSWENDLQKTKAIYINKVHICNKITDLKIEKKDFSTADQYLNEIEKLERDIKLFRLNQNRRKHLDKIPEYLIELENINSKNTEYPEIDPALRLEYLVSNILIGLNFATQIKPNYLADENGWPIYFAPGGTADIESYYDSFNMIFEVTLIKSRDQQYKNETQPVMRHLRDFEDKYKTETICVFIAPVIHRDTLNAFWSSVKYEYEGKPQKIIPLTIKQFINIIEILYSVAKEGKLNQQIIRAEFDKLIKINNLNSCVEWQKSMQEALD